MDNVEQPVDNAEQIAIRPFSPGDLGDLYRICLQTADSGRDATPLFRDPLLPGHVFAAPYATFEPSLAFVAEDQAGVQGYVLGALDSTEFERRLEERWWPALRRRYPGPPAGLAEEHWTRDQQMAHRIQHRWTVPRELAERYPSHLHIDLLPPVQGRGLGRRLIETLTAALRAQGSRGVHLHVGKGNARAAGFYSRVGFTELDSPSPAVRVFAMDLRDGPAR